MRVNRNREEESKEWGGVTQSEFRQNGGSSPDTEGDRPPREKHGDEKSGFFAKKDTGEWWADFPTQPPVCSRDDGFPARLDGITFPKWRNESIKAYGNAMVPQVIYQIFKAIEQYETNT